MMYNINDYHVQLDKLGKIIIYLRKSREDMIDGKYLSDEETLSRHEGQLQQWAKQYLGYEIPQENIYKEVGSGEKISTRPVFQEVLHQLENDPEIDGLLVVNCSRISRGSLGDIYQIIKTLEISDVKVLTPMKLYNLKNKYDKRFFQDELTRGNDYLETVKELLGNGRHWSVSCGKFIQSKAPYGYDKVTCKEMKVADEKGFTLRPNKEEAPYVKKMFELCLNGYGVRRIANYLNEVDAPKIDEKDWNRCKVYRLLTNETFYGYLTYGKRAVKEKMVNGEVIIYRPKNEDYPIYKGLHEPIISKEVWESVQEKLKGGYNIPVSDNKNIKNPFASILKCSYCGKSLKRHTRCKTRKVRKQEIDKYELREFLKSYKNKLGYTNRKIAESIDVNENKVSTWFGGKIENFYIGKLLTDNWFKLKEVLNIGENKYDKMLFEFIEEDMPDNIYCDTPNCNNIGSRLDIVEEKVLSEIKAKYNEYEYFLENYEVEIIKKINSNKKSVSSIDKKIDMLNKQLKNARILFEQEVDTLEEYIARKKELTKELEELEKEKQQLVDYQEEEKIISIKKSIPLLKNVFDNYHKLNAEQKNELLKSVIQFIVYDKQKQLSSSPYLTRKEMLDSFTIDICWIE